MTSAAIASNYQKEKIMHKATDFGLINRFNMVYIVLDKALLEIKNKQKSEPKLNIFSRYLKSCNNDGHRIQESYWDSAKTKLMTRCVVDKNGKNDGPYLHYSDDGKSVTSGWYRKGKPHGKWIKKNSEGYITYFETIHNKNGEKIAPDTSISNGKLNKFWYNAKTDEMHNIMTDGKVDNYYKEAAQRRISAMQAEGKSGTVLLDERISKLRARIHKEPETAVVKEHTEKNRQNTGKVINTARNSYNEGK